MVEKEQRKGEAGKGERGLGEEGLDMGKGGGVGVREGGKYARRRRRERKSVEGWWKLRLAEMALSNTSVGRIGFARDRGSLVHSTTVLARGM